MSESTTRALIAAGVIGLALYLLTKQTATATVARPPASAGPGQVSTSLTNDINAFGKLVSGLGGLFKTSSSAPVPASTTAAINPNPPAATWSTSTASDGTVSNSLGDSYSPTDPGIAGPTSSETALGIGPADYF